MADKAAPKAEAKAAPAAHGHGHGAQKFTGMSRWFNTYTYRGKTTIAATSFTLGVGGYLLAKYCTSSKKAPADAKPSASAEKNAKPAQQKGNQAPQKNAH